MFKALLLKDLIQEKISFRPLHTGWSVGKCELCGDYKERAGFKFEDNKVVYNCWNCGKASAYEELSGEISNNMRNILTRYGIDDSEISTVVNSAFFRKEEEKQVITLSSVKEVNTSTPPIKLPANSFRLGGVADFIDYQTKLVKYLMDRKIDIDKFPFYFCMSERMMNRVIIPFYRNGQLIYWQARSILPTEKKRYDNSPNSRDAVMYNMDKLTQYTDLPLFCTEGVFDAMPLDGIATLGSKLTEAQKILLAKSPRRKIFVIDKDKNGRHMAEEVLSLGYEITFAPEGATDVNKSVQRFGIIWTVHELMKNIPKNADDARVKINLNCI